MSQAIVREVRERTDIVDLVSQQVQLKRTGKTYKGLCPFHQEKTPSFFVFPESQHYHCFGCHKGGDVFSFLMDTGNMSFGDALKDLAQRAGIALPSRVPVAPEVDAHRRDLIEVNQLAAQYFANYLTNAPGGSKARDYVSSRGLDDLTVARFQIGASPDSWDGLLGYLEKRDINLSLAHDAGLLQQRDNGGYYDRFRDRLMFPIRDRDGNTVGFGGRELGGQEPKYLNSPQTPVFDKSALLYGLSEAREEIKKRDLAIIVEGYMDVVTAHQFGEANVVASMGTAITDLQIDLLQRYSRTIVLALDADAAGQLAMLRSLEVAPKVLETTRVIVPDPRTMFRMEQKLKKELLIAELPAGSDPDSIIRSDLGEWLNCIRTATAYMTFLIDKIVTEEVRGNPTRKRDAVERILPVLQLIADPVEQDHYVNLLKQRSQLSYAELKSMLRRTALRATPHVNTWEIGAASLRPTTEDYLVALLLQYRELVDDLLVRVPLNEIIDPRNRDILNSLLEHQGQPDADITNLASAEDHTREHALFLISLFQGVPASLPQKVREDTETTLLNLEKEHHKRLVEYLRADIAEAESLGNSAELSELAQLLATELDRHKSFYPRPSGYFADIREGAEAVKRGSRQ